MTRYDLIELAQLVFALAVMIAAFAGGVAVGWWRWGRDRLPVGAPEAPPHPGAGPLFSPDDRDEIDLSMLHAVRNSDGHGRPGLFTAAPAGANEELRPGAGELVDATRAALEAPSPMGLDGDASQA